MLHLCDSIISDELRYSGARSGKGMKDIGRADASGLLLGRIAPYTTAA